MNTERYKFHRIKQGTFHSITFCLITYITTLESLETMATPAVESAFQRACADFRKSMKPKDQTYFSQITTHAELIAEVSIMEKKQAMRKSVRNIRQIRPFLDFLSQYEKIIEVFVGVSSRSLSFQPIAVVSCLVLFSLYPAVNHF